MKYFLDTEFIDNGFDIHLISIGIVCEDGREYYAINENCPFQLANPWVQENVLEPMGIVIVQEDDEDLTWVAEDSALSEMKSRDEIVLDVLNFIKKPILAPTEQPIRGYQELAKAKVREKIWIWTYYGAYDHVVLCQLFGTMMDLPEGFPMYTMDIKQYCRMLGDPKLPKQDRCLHNALEDARWNKLAYEFLRKYEIDWKTQKELFWLG